MKSIPLVCLALFASLNFTPSLTLAADATRGIEIRPKSVVVSVKGSAFGAQSGKLRFRDAVAYGERIRTAENSYAGILLGDSAVVVMLDNSEIELGEESQGQVIKLYGGTVRLAVAGTKMPSGQAVIVQTPTTRTITRSTLAQIELTAGSKKAGLDLGGRNLVRVMAAASQAANVENFNVFEGNMEVTTPGNPPVNVGSGQAAQVTNGTPGQPVSGSAGDGFVPDLLADENHGQTPQPLLESMSNDQMAQAQALGSAIAGETGSGTTLAKQNEEQIIIASASSVSGNTQPPPPGPIQPSPPVFGPGSNPFGGNPNSINISGSGYVDDINDDADLPRVPPGLHNLNVKGGSGLLLFTAKGSRPSRFTTESELLLIDGGNRTDENVPHGGREPNKTLIVGGLTASHLKLRLQTAGAFDPDPPQNIIDEDVLVATKTPVSPLYVAVGFDDNVLLTTTSRDDLDSLFGQIKVVKIFDTTECNQISCENLGLFSRTSDGRVAEDPEYKDQSFDLESLVMGAITARSKTDGTVNERRVTLEGGVVLDQQTELTVGSTPATTGFFGGSSEYDGSVIGVIAKDNNPGLVKIKDRALAVLGGSTIAPEGNSKISLLSVLDSQLIGPDTIPEDRTGDNVGVPPLIEMVESKSSKPNDVGVNATSAVVVRSTGLLNGVVDDGLLKASAPLVALVSSTMRTSGNFADFSGPGNLLNATLLPADALVRLDGSKLAVNGHAFSFTNGATATITGNMASLTNGSNFSIQNGAFLNVGAASTVNLNGSFALFGAGNNQLSVANSLCSASCTLLNGAVPVAGTGTVNGVKLTGGTLNLTNGFVPFRSLDGKATNADGSARVNSPSNAAFLVINGSLNLNPGPAANPAAQVASQQTAAGQAKKR